MPPAACKSGAPVGYDTRLHGQATRNAKEERYPAR